ncbi:hypothetical protein [Colwellia psychrerythraea]|uniref:Preprotein translocase subunit SecE n=1 Tax=Colwellia psychrerythraea TaxID=28229 RepID=A0A099KKY1_COLPS|nr:hypothetical protein [Colwellia psychrerythraea]KGJ90930.1 hypothetical protein GAB14E_0594 [Colwellia psychrerythraea]
MKEDLAELKSELKSKLLYWHNLKSKKIKAAAIVLFIGVIALKIFTTVLTFDWLSELFS